MCDTFLFGFSPPKKANQPTILSLKVRRLHSPQRITSVPWVSMAWNDTEWHLTNFVLGTRSQNILYVLIISSVTFPYASDAIHLIQSRGRVAAWVSGRFSLIQTSVSKLKVSSLFLRCPSWRPCCTANSSVRVCEVPHSGTKIAESDWVLLLWMECSQMDHGCLREQSRALAFVFLLFGTTRSKYLWLRSQCFFQ